VVALAYSISSSDGLLSDDVVGVDLIYVSFISTYSSTIILG